MNHNSDSGPQNPDADSPRGSSSGSRDGSFSGRLKALSISDVLEFLRVLGRRGTLVLRDSGRQVSLQVHDGLLVAAEMPGEAGSLAAFLLQEGQLTREQHESVRERERNGERVGRILIETGLLTPKGVWEALRRQARATALGLFEWEQGEFQFREGEEIAPGGMEMDLPLLEIIADGIRGVKATRLFAQRMPSSSSVFEAIPPGERKASLPLEPHERYVLGLIGAGRSVSEVSRASEIGEAETLRVIFLLFSVGYLKMRAAQASPREGQQAELLPLVRRYNEMFGFLHSYLVKEVGPIGEAVMGRYFEEQKKAQPSLLAEGRLGRDGTLDERTLVRNAGSLGDGNRTEKLVDGLNELLYAELLAVRRTLGASHEARAVQGLREMGLQPVIQPELPAEAPGRE